MDTPSRSQLAVAALAAGVVTSYAVAHGDHLISLLSWRLPLASGADAAFQQQEKAIIAVRQDMPALANKACFNYGGQGPLPTASLHAMAASWRRIQQLAPFAQPVFCCVEELIAPLRRALWPCASR